MYDYLVELPGFPAATAILRAQLVWTGSSTAAANTWDNALTTSFKENTTATAFGTGDAVTFDAAGFRHHQRHPQQYVLLHTSSLS